MKVKRVFNFKLLAPGFGAITLYPYIFFRASENEVSASTLRHEMIHVRQVRRLGWVKFYSSYLFHYGVGLFKYLDNDKAYRAIPYEVEAYRDQDKIALTKSELVELGLD